MIKEYEQCNECPYYLYCKIRKQGKYMFKILRKKLGKLSYQKREKCRIKNNVQFCMDCYKYPCSKLTGWL